MGLARFICGYANVFITFDTFYDGPLLNKGSTLHNTLKGSRNLLRPVVQCIRNCRFRSARSSRRLLNQSIDKFDNCCSRGGSIYRGFFKAREYFLLAWWNVKFSLSPSVRLSPGSQWGCGVEGRLHTRLHLFYIS